MNFIEQLRSRIKKNWHETSSESLGGAWVTCTYCGNSESDWYYVIRDFKHKPDCPVILIDSIFGNFEQKTQKLVDEEILEAISSIVNKWGCGENKVDTLDLESGA